jgi:hypothetical protein
VTTHDHDHTHDHAIGHEPQLAFDSVLTRIDALVEMCEHSATTPPTNVHWIVWDSVVDKLRALRTQVELLAEQSS